MLEKVKEYAMEKFAGDEGLADEFVSGFVKASMSNDAFSRVASAKSVAGNRTMQSEIKSGLANQLGKGLVGVILNAGLATGAYGFNQIKRNNLHSQFLQSLETAIASNPTLKQYNREKIKQYAETVFRFAPNIASDVNLLTNVLVYAVQGDSLDINIIKSLTELDGKYTSNSSFMPQNIKLT